MKKQIKILTTVLMVVVILATLGNVVLGAQSTIDALKNPGTVQGVDKVQNLGKQIVGILQVVGIVVAVVVLLVLGISVRIWCACSAHVVRSWCARKSSICTNRSTCGRHQLCGQ